MLHSPAVYGIFGYPIGHSLSPVMHNTAFAYHGMDAVYVPFAVHPGQIEAAVKALRALQIRGVNVTIPHKQAVIPWLDELTSEARLIGAVNTIQLQGGRLLGHNTDGIGFLRSLEEAGAAVEGQRVLLLGAGGAARAIAVQLCLSRVRCLYIANRTRARAEELAAFLQGHLPGPRVSVLPLEGAALATCLPHVDILVNATSVGMESADTAPLPVTGLCPSQLVCDIVYRPRLTPLLQAAQYRGARTVDGVGMLVHQGAKAFEIWTGRSFPIPLVRARLLEALEARGSGSAGGDMP